MILTLAFCSKDAELQLKNLEWMLELDSGCGREGVLAYDTATLKPVIEQIEALATRYFSKVHHCLYQEPPVKGWPAACNWAWQSTARWMFSHGPKQPWLWLEADAVPLRCGWLLELEKAFQTGGKSFGGHVVKDMGHMNGVGIYPWDVMRRNEMAMLARAAAWDVVLKPSTINDCTPLNHLIQHAWNVHPIDRAMIWNGEGSPLSFKSQEDVTLYMDFNAVLLHRVKDGSLIPLLREKHLAEQERQRLIMSTEYNVPQHVPQTYDKAKDGSDSLGGISQERGEGVRVEARKEVAQSNVQSYDKDLRENGSGGDVQPSEQSVDDHVTSSSSAQPDVVGHSSQVDGGHLAGVSSNQTDSGDTAANSFQGKCEILIVTYGLPTKRQSGIVVSDFDWLVWCMRGIRRYCSGFSGVTLAIPSRDAELLKPITKEHANSNSGIKLRVRMFDEPLGKGMLMHMGVIGLADRYVPADTTHVLHLDADCIAKAPITPSEYIGNDGRPVYVVRSYESLTDTVTKVVSDCAQWKAVAEENIGMPIDTYAMLRHPSCFPIDFYPKFRQQVVVAHGVPFLDYVLSCKNEFPQTFAEFPAMGGFAMATMKDRFNWIDVSGGNHLAPKDKFKVFWSHHGVHEAVKKEIEALIA